MVRLLLIYFWYTYTRNTSLAYLKCRSHEILYRYLVSDSSRAYTPCCFYKLCKRGQYLWVVTAFVNLLGLMHLYREREIIDFNISLEYQIYLTR